MKLDFTTPLRYRPRIRKILRKISNHVLEERICDYLYPDDCTIRFHDFSPEYWEQKALETLRDVKKESSDV